MGLSSISIETERLRLRSYRKDDVEPLVGYYSDPEVCRFLLHEPWDRAAADQAVRKRMQRTSLQGPEAAVALVVEVSGIVVGDVVVWATDATGLRAEAGWVFDPRHSGRGYATEAMRALLDHVFKEFGLHRIVAQMDDRNAGSARLCERLGMVREARLRQDAWLKGEWRDVVTYGLLSTDPRPGS